MNPNNFPTVDLPGNDRGQIEDFREQMRAAGERQIRTRLGFLSAMRAKGAVPFLGVGPEEKRRRRAAGKRQRAARRAAR